MDQLPSLVDVLVKLAGGAGVGAIVAFLLERVAWFQGLTSGQRSAVVLALCMGLPLGAALALQFVPASVWALLDPYWKALALGFLVWMGSQWAHAQDKGE